MCEEIFHTTVDYQHDLAQLRPWPCSVFQQRPHLIPTKSTWPLISSPVPSSLETGLHRCGPPWDTQTWKFIGSSWFSQSFNRNHFSLEPQLISSPASGSFLPSTSLTSVPPFLTTLFIHCPLCPLEPQNLVRQRFLSFLSTAAVPLPGTKAGILILFYPPQQP